MVTACQGIKVTAGYYTDSNLPGYFDITNLLIDYESIMSGSCCVGRSML